MGDTILGGSKSLPPPELGFIDWVGDATKAVKAKYPKAIIIDDVAKKQSLLGGKGKYVLDISASFRVQDSMGVTVTKDDTFNISNPEDIMVGAGDVKDMSKVSYDPWKLISSNPNLQNYSTFRLYRPLGNPAVKPLRPDQPYYAFKDDNQKPLGLFGASDGKIYKN